ncbi:MAG: DNA-3-methyladenine glycosylase 2 family protein [Oscillospiraceae bacterium]|jgi:N-glycosylase/DNA lyase|nr:DNA-3-methyladenine glycosylase 2 family protein [Oscillospiraceae bacterium]
MEITVSNGDIVILSPEDFAPEPIFECGQCFRWNKSGEREYAGVAFGKPLRIIWDDARVTLCGAADDEALWREYFDLDRDYGEIRSAFGFDAHMSLAAQFGRGIRILRQEPWEALCSFIVSQCNNIPRIKKIIEALCRLCGEAIGDGLYAFPAPERVADLSPEQLSSLRAGYRGAYIHSAALSVSSGAFDLGAASRLPEKDALAALLSLPGVGTKVASCAALFGLHMLDFFPIDTWMKKSLANHYPGGFDPKAFSPYAGIAQQYLFYYERSGQQRCPGRAAERKEKSRSTR